MSRRAVAALPFALALALTACSGPAPQETAEPAAGGTSAQAPEGGAESQAPRTQTSETASPEGAPSGEFPAAAPALGEFPSDVDGWSGGSAHFEGGHMYQRGGEVVLAAQQPGDVWQGDEIYDDVVHPGDRDWMVCGTYANVQASSEGQYMCDVKFSGGEVYTMGPFPTKDDAVGFLADLMAQMA